MIRGQQQVFLEQALEAIELLHRASEKLSFPALSYTLAAAKSQAENDLTAVRGTSGPRAARKVVTFGRREVFVRRGGDAPTTPRDGKVAG
jgi:hypothetical protein